MKKKHILSSLCIATSLHSNTCSKSLSDSNCKGCDDTNILDYEPGRPGLTPRITIAPILNSIETEMPTHFLFKSKSCNKLFEILHDDSNINSNMYDFVIAESSEYEDQNLRLQKFVSRSRPNIENGTFKLGISQTQTFFDEYKKTYNENKEYRAYLYKVFENKTGFMQNKDYSSNLIVAVYIRPLIKISLYKSVANLGEILLQSKYSLKEDLINLMWVSKQGLYDIEVKLDQERTKDRKFKSPFPEYTISNGKEDIHTISQIIRWNRAGFCPTIWYFSKENQRFDELENFFKENNICCKLENLTSILTKDQFLLKQVDCGIKDSRKESLYNTVDYLRLVVLENCRKLCTTAVYADFVVIPEDFIPRNKGFYMAHIDIGKGSYENTALAVHGEGTALNEALSFRDITDENFFDSDTTFVFDKMQTPEFKSKCNQINIKVIRQSNHIRK